MPDFFVENWHLVLFGVVILWVLVWEVLHKHQSINAERMIRALVLLFASYGIAWVTQQVRDNQEKQPPYLIKIMANRLASAADNDYAKGLLDDLEQRLNKFEVHSSEAEMESDVRSHLIRALKATHRSAWFLDHYVLVWGEPAHPEMEENANAVKRGVEVRRTFVLSDALTRSRDEITSAVRVMDKQRSLGIRVFFVLQTQLQSYPEYSRHADVNYGVFDNKLLAKISARASPRANPTYCLLSWDPSLLAHDNPQAWLENTGQVKEYSDSAKALLLRLPVTLTAAHYRAKGNP
jgi:hypothetical protein